MKFISLFAGIGGFDLGMEQAGHECVAQVEWDKNAAGVLKRRWPDVPLFCDVTKARGGDLPDCDFITYGFPCQDLSVAGRRKGLKGERSGLFFEATRLIRELRAGGSRLRFAVAENVAGLLSADDGVALPVCLAELADCGAVETGWRVLDSQYFGVAQRRRRVFLVSDFGGESCDQILALTESLCGHPAPRRQTGQGLAADAGASAQASGRFQDGGDAKEVVQGADVYNGELTGETSPTVTSATGISNASGPKVLGFKANQSAEAHGLGIQEEVSPTLEGGGGGNNKPAIIHPQGQQTLGIQGNMIGRKEENGPQGSGINKDVSFTLNATDQHGVAHPIQNATRGKDQNGMGVGEGDDPMYTLDNASQHAIAHPQGQQVMSWCGDETPKAAEDVSVTLRSQQGGEGVGVAHQGDKAFQQNERCEVRYVGGDGSIAGALAGDPGMHNQNFVQNMVVRRLTPTECERLQGFPDDWTEEREELELIDNQWHATPFTHPQADGPRYRQLGNAVTVNVAKWIGERLASTKRSE